METRERQSAVNVRLPEYGVFVFESRHAPGFQTGTMRHRFLKVLLVLTGAGELSQGPHTLGFSAGDVLYVPPGLPHRLTDRPGSAASLLACCARADDARRGVTRTLGLRLLPGSADVRPAVEGLLRRMHFEQSSGRAGAPLLLRSLADALLVALSRAAERPPAARDSSAMQRVRAVSARMERGFFEPFSLAEAAERAGLSRRRFTDLFRRVTGQSYHDRLQSLRVAHAQRLLTTTRESVTAIAFACGFDDLSTFYRAFAKRAGCSPLQWRAAGRST